MASIEDRIAETREYDATLVDRAAETYRITAESAADNGLMDAAERYRSCQRVMEAVAAAIRTAPAPVGEENLTNVAPITEKGAGDHPHPDTRCNATDDAQGNGIGVVPPPARDVVPDFREPPITEDEERLIGSVRAELFKRCQDARRWRGESAAETEVHDAICRQTRRLVELEDFVNPARRGTPKIPRHGIRVSMSPQ